jgi:hypothetical protein
MDVDIVFHGNILIKKTSVYVELTFILTYLCSSIIVLIINKLEIMKPKTPRTRPKTRPGSKPK